MLNSSKLQQLSWKGHNFATTWDSSWQLLKGKPVTFSWTISAAILVAAHEHTMSHVTTGHNKSQTGHNKSQQVTRYWYWHVNHVLTYCIYVIWCYLCIVFISIAASYWISYYAMHSLCSLSASRSQGTAVQETERCWVTSPLHLIFTRASSRSHYCSRPDLTRSGILLKSATWHCLAMSISWTYRGGMSWQCRDNVVML